MSRTVRVRPLPSVNPLPATLHPVLRRVYAARGVRSGAELDYSLSRLPAFESLTDIGLAADLIGDALIRRRPILIVADFDADGATSCALAVRALLAMGAAEVRYLVPSRFKFGYGLTPELVDLAAQMRPHLLITVDNGIASVDGVARARAAGMRVLITDHHLPGARRPAADAIVNPNQDGDAFPCKHLAGVGVIFYVLTALRARLREQGWFVQSGIAEPRLAEWLDLVALGTVADLVPLDYTNRILVAQGLARIRAGYCRPGIKALMRLGGRELAAATPADLAYAIAPRLNAAGRMSHMSLGIECLLSDRPDEAAGHARILDELNRERRTVQAEMEDRARTIVERLAAQGLAPAAGLCLYDAHWHQGVTGILAARVKERVERPVVVFARGDEGLLKGSARSIPGVHIRDVLDLIAKRRPDLMSRFGGHAAAAGLSLPAARLDEFRELFDTTVQECLGEGGLQPGVIYTDGELEADDLTLDNAQLLRTAGPWGQGFPEPSFGGEFAIRDQRVVGDVHLKLTLEAPGAVRPLEAIAFNQGGAPVDGGVLSAVYRLDVNSYGGISSLQLVIEQLDKPAGGK